MKKITEPLTSVAVLLFGGLPSLAFFIWIERNMALPWVGTWIGWPWVFIEGGPGGGIFFNLGLITVFGFLHSSLAGRAPRALYTIIAGASAILVMATWQPSGVILYQLIPSAALSSLVSVLAYWSLLGIGARSLAQVESAGQFIGLIQKDASNSKAKLWTGGLYAYVRHPIYAFTLAAWLLTPMMSLDRLVFVLGMSVYLAFGIRHEEARMVQKFGQDYLDYQRKTPMIIPTFSRARIRS